MPLTRRNFLGGSLALPLLTLPGLPARAEADAQAEPGLDAARDWIEESRDLARSLLKPSKRELERGLELHAESVVVDTYGFAPRARLDAEALHEAVDAGASAAEYQDLREEMMMTRCVTDAAERAQFQHAFREAGVTCLIQNAGEEGQDPLRMIKRLGRFTWITDAMGEFIGKAITADQVLQAHEQGRHCLYLATNGVPLAQQWRSVERELQYVRVFHQLGVRTMHLTYNRRNMLADGCAEEDDNGVSDFGQAAIREMNRVGVVVDVAHTGWRSSREAAEISDQPVVASHTTADEVYHHIRAKPDDVIRAIADGGGYVGICCIPRFLGHTGDVRALIDHIDYVARKFGPDHVSIGTDIAYRSRLPQGDLPRRPRRRTEFRSLWPDDPFQTTGEMRRSMAWTNWPLFTVGLVQKGLSDDDIRKIIGGNALRVMRHAHGNTRPET